MIPKSLSASSLAVFSLCPSRWQAENLNKGEQMDGEAASLGSACHGACENYVKMCYMERTQEPTLKLLLDLYQMSYVIEFGTADTETELYKDGVKMLTKWFKRTSFDGFDVLSVEVKKSIDIPVVVDGVKQTIPYNYIMDRQDKFHDGTYRVVDYKSIRVPITPEQLRGKIQARSYALACQIEHPEAERVLVEFDMFRHESVGVYFTREDNKRTWKYLKAEAQRIVDTPNTEVEERLNWECGYCIRKLECKTLQSNQAAGGTAGLEPDRAAETRYRAQSQIRGLERLIEEVDEILMKEAVARDELEWDTPFGKVEIKASRRRQAQTDRIAEIIGPELMKQYGNMTMGNIDALLSGTDLTEEQKVQVRSCVSWGMPGDPKPKITPADPIEE